MFQILEASDNNRNKWTEYVNSIPNPIFYYDYRWKQVLEESFKLKCFYLMAVDRERVNGVFPLVFIKSRIMATALISIPFFNYGGILANDEEIASFLFNKAIDILKKIRAKYIEIRSLNKLGLVLITREHKVTMWLDLSKEVTQQWAQLDAKVRNQIRKAEKSGLTIRQSKTELLDKFYFAFSQNMRDIGTPVIGKVFFENILKYFPDESNIFVVEYKSKVIAAAFTLHHSNTIEIPWASSIKAFNKLCPNEFMYWEIIKYAIACGVNRFDFGRCTKDSGTYKFKKQWDPVIKQLYWQYWAKQESDLPTENPKKSKFAKLISVWQRLPFFIANRLGPVIAKEITTF